MKLRLLSCKTIAVVLHEAEIFLCDLSVIDFQVEVFEQTGVKTF